MCIRKRFIASSCARACVSTRTCTAYRSFARHRHLAPLCTTVDQWSSHQFISLNISLLRMTVSYIAASRSSAICDLYSTCASALRTRIVLTRCPLLSLWIELLPVFCLDSSTASCSVLVYLSRLLIVAVANELATLRCVSLAVSASQERKQRGTVFEILLSSFPPCWCQNWLCLCRKLFPSTSQDSGCPRENVDAELSASTADAVLEFSVSVLASAFFASAPRHASGSS